MDKEVVIDCIISMAMDLKEKYDTANGAYDLMSVADDAADLANFILEKLNNE